MFTILSEKNQERLFAFVVCLTVFFLFYPTYLPLVDLPQHASQITALDDMLKGNSQWHDFIVVDWNSPYLLCYLCWLLLYQFFSILIATKLIVIIIFLSYVFSIRYLRKAFDSPMLLEWASLTCFFGFAYQWGFISFLSGIPLGLVFLVFNKKWFDVGEKKYLAGMFLSGALGYFSHILPFSFFCFISYLYLITSLLSDFSPSNKVKFIKATIVYSLLSILLFYYVYSVATAFDSGTVFEYHNDKMIFPSFMTRTSNMFHMPWNMLNVDYYNIAFVLMYFLPVLMGYKLTKSAPKYALCLGVLIIWYVFPTKAFRVVYLQERFAIFIIPFYYLLWERRENIMGRMRDVAQLASVLFLLVFSSLMYKVYANNVNFEKSTSTQDFIGILKTMKPEKKVFFMFNTRTSGALTYHMEELYIPNWYQAQKRGWVDFNFAVFSPMIVHFKQGYLKKGYGKHRGLHKNNLLTLNCKEYDYLIIRINKQNQKTSQQINNWLEQNPSCPKMKLEQEARGWLLYANY